MPAMRPSGPDDEREIVQIETSTDFLLFSKYSMQ